MIPTLAGSPALTAGTNNPILDEIDRAHATLSPGAQAALAKAKLGMTPGVLPGPLPEMGGGTLTTPPPGPIAAPRTIPSLGAPKAPLVPPMTPVQTGHQNELARLTAPPPSDPSLIHSHQNTGASGIDQIKHAGIRVPLQILQAIGGGFFPNVAALTPGTQMHHQLLVRQAQGNVASDESQRKTEAEVGHLGAETENLESEANARDNPAKVSKITNEFEKWMADNPNAGLQEWEDFKAKNSKTAAAKDQTPHTIATDQGILQFNQETGRYDIPVGKSPDKATTGTIHQLEDGSLIMAHADGTATPVTLNGQAVKGKPTAEKTVNPEQQFVDEFMKKNPGATIAKAQRAYKLNQEVPPQTDHGVNVIDPAANRLLRIQPGGTLPKGAITMSGENTLNTPTETERSAGGRATTMVELDQRIRRALQNPEIAKGTGPLAGRLSEAQNRLGTLPHDLAELKNDLVSYGAFQAGLHPVRGIGGIEYFDKVMGGLGQNPEELLGKLDSNLATARSVQKVGGVQNQGGVLEPKSKAEYDALPKGAVYMKDGNQFTKK